MRKLRIDDYSQFKFKRQFSDIINENSKSIIVYSIDTLSKHVNHFICTDYVRRVSPSIILYNSRMKRSMRMVLRQVPLCHNRKNEKTTNAEA